MGLLIGLIIILVVIGLILVGIYNSLIKGRNKVNESWADIDVQLKRRYDLIPNLVETVKGYAAHEKKVLTNVTEARAKAMGVEGPKDKAAAENMLSKTLKTLFAVAENYPNLKANENFLDLQKQLGEIEDSIQKARRFYNGTVRDFNTRLQSFPINLIGGMFGFKSFEYFEVAESREREAAKVKF